VKESTGNPGNPGGGTAGIDLAVLVAEHGEGGGCGAAEECDDRDREREGEHEMTLCGER
jgi:hypothetical protein